MHMFLLDTRIGGSGTVARVISGVSDFACMFVRECLVTML